MPRFWLASCDTKLIFDLRHYSNFVISALLIYIAALGLFIIFDNNQEFKIRHYYSHPEISQGAKRAAIFEYFKSKSRLKNLIVPRNLNCWISSQNTLLTFNYVVNVQHMSFSPAVHKTWFISMKFNKNMLKQEKTYVQIPHNKKLIERNWKQ